jgi:imidazolonepropionase
LSNTILLRGAKQLLSLRGPAGPRRGNAVRDLAIIEDGSLLIRDGKIVHIGSTRRLENLKEAREALEIPAHGRVVMPGFADPGLNFGLRKRGEAQRSLKKKKPAELYAEALELLRACMQHGTLAAELKVNAEPEDPRSAISVLRQLSKLHSQYLTAVNTWSVNGTLPRDGDFTKILEVIARRKLAHFIELHSSGGPFDDEILKRIQNAELALKLYWPGGRPEQLEHLLARLRPLSVFCSHTLSMEEIAVLANHPALVVFSPGKNALDGPPVDSIRGLLDAGGAIALSSGYDPDHSPSFSMQMMIALAVFRLRLTAEEAITAATINAACAFGVGNHSGSLEAGKRANVLILDVSDYRDLPRQFGINHVAMAIRDGTIVFNRTRWRTT